MERVLAIFIDALRYDGINRNDTPFLHQLCMRGAKIQLKPILGYSDAIRATIFTGAYPDRNGYWMSYKYSPQTSPYKPFRIFRFVDMIPSDLMRRGFKFVLTMTLCKLLARAKGYSTLHLHNIPFSIVGRFDASLRKSMLDENVFSGHPTIFDVLRNNGIGFEYFDSSTLKRKLPKQLSRMNPDTRFALVYLHYIDEASHWFGLGSRRFREALGSVDSLVKSAVETATRVWKEEPAIVVFSDHGMIEELRRVDLSHLTKLAEFGKTFMFTLDATMIRVWYFREGERAKVQRKLEEIGHCRRLSESEKKNFGIDFKNGDYGEEIFLFDPGHILFPNFHSYVRPRAMHAYDPEHPTQRGIFVIQSKTRQVFDGESMELVNIAPTICALLGVPTPPSYEGKSVIA